MAELLLYLHLYLYLYLVLLPSQWMPLAAGPPLGWHCVTLALQNERCAFFVGCTIETWLRCTRSSTTMKRTLFTWC